jgi:hypothetical protein
MKKLEDPKKFFDLLEKSIIEVIKNDGDIIKNDSLSLKEYKNKYSNLPTPSLTLFSGDIPLNSKLFKVKYECLCGNINDIHLKKFLSKDTLICPKCRETDEKRKRHSDLLKNPNFKKKIKPIKNNDLNYFIDKSINDFKLETPEFIKNYYEKNISELEFNQLKPKITKINGVDVLGVDYQFLPTLKVNNQSKYSQYITIGGEKVLFCNIQYNCDNCNKNFNTTRKPKEKVKNHKLLCPTCSFCNKTFKVRKYETKFGDIITYQSKFEKEFIKNCEELNIKILDGINVDYELKGKKHKYRIDFLLPDHNLLIELKGNHIWHRNQLQSGVWKVKQTEAEKYSLKNNLIYKLLFQENIKDFFTSIKI